jgi:hypothetical protein
MAFLSSRTTFPDFNKSKNYFLTGLGGPPAVDIAEDFGAPGGAGAAVSAPPAAPTTGQATTPATTTPAAPTVEATAPPAAELYTPPTLGYGDPGQAGGGGLYGQLVDPVVGAAQAGSADVMGFADQFRTAAGPSRTYADIGAEATLSGAVEGAPMGPAFDLVGAQYQGPAGLDPTGVGGLGFLQGQLETREQNLGTGAGLTSAIGQTVQTLTPGEARFEAEAMFDPAYRAALATDLAPIGQFTGELATETQAAKEFAESRAAQEADIAAKSTEYLTGRGEGITGDIQAQIDEITAQQLGASQAFSGVLDTEDPAAMIEALRKAQAGGFTDPSKDVGQFETEAFKASQGAEANQQAIINDPQWASLKDVPIGEVGVDKKGRQTYMIPDENGDLKDFRTVLGTGQDAVDFKARQAALEEAFSSQRGVSFPGGRTTGDRFGAPTGQQLTNPLYFGEQFQGPEIASYLGFEPGFRPSRENVSSEEQRDQYNRIQELLSNLDRMSEDKENPWKYAMITANLEGYLEDEAAGLEAQGDKLSKEGKEWFGMVKSLRKRYRKHEREKKGAKIGGGIGAVLLAALGPDLGGAIGANVGESLAR